MVLFSFHFEHVWLLDRMYFEHVWVLDRMYFEHVWVFDRMYFEICRNLTSQSTENPQRHINIKHLLGPVYSKRHRVNKINSILFKKQVVYEVR